MPFQKTESDICVIVTVFLSLERDGRCATTSMSAGQTSGCPKVLLPCWTSVSMYFRGGRLQSRAWAPVGRGLRGVPLWLCTAVPALAAQVNACPIVGFKCTFTIRLVATSLDMLLCLCKDLVSCVTSPSSFFHLCSPTRHVLYTGHLPVPAGGHRHSRRPSDGAAHAYTEGFQHPDLGPVLLLLHSSHRVCPAPWETEPGAVV